MNLDERLKALTHSLKVTAARQRDRARRVEQQGGTLEEPQLRVTDAIESLSETNRKLAGLAAEIQQSQAR